MAAGADPVRQRLEYIGVVVARAVTSVLPYPLLWLCGTSLGYLFYLVDGKHRRVASENLAAAFPRRTRSERQAIVRAMFAHFGRLLFEFLKFSTLSPERIQSRVEFDGEERVRLAYQQGKGVLFITGHFGFWELHAVAHPLRFEPIGVLARTLDNARLNMLLAVNVEFFERTAATTSAVAAMALRTGAPVVPVFALPLGRGRYRLIYEHPVEPPAADSENAVREFTQRCTDVLEMYVRRHPDLWLWMHRRWRDD